MKKWKTVKELIAEHRTVFGDGFEFEATNLKTGQVVSSKKYKDPSGRMKAVTPTISAFSNGTASRMGKKNGKRK